MAAYSGWRLAPTSSRSIELWAFPRPDEVLPKTATTRSVVRGSQRIRSALDRRRVFPEPTKTVSRIAKVRTAVDVGSLDFVAVEIREFLKKSDDWLRACILLDINAGFGNVHCAKLRADHIVFRSGWYDLTRQKSGIPSQFIIWKRTRDAIAETMRERPVPQMDNDGLCFLTSHGRPVFWESVHPEKKTVSRCDNVGKESTKLVKNCGFPAGSGFCTLRFQLNTTQRREQWLTCLDNPRMLPTHPAHLLECPGGRNRPAVLNRFPPNCIHPAVQQNSGVAVIGNHSDPLGRF